MELSELIEKKKRELQDLIVKLERLRSESEKVKEKFPPLWSGNIRELHKFVSDLEKWVRNPQVKRARDLIEELKKQGQDTRSFSGLAEEYLVNNLDVLEEAVTFVSKIENDLLKANAAKKILNEIQEEKDIRSLLQAIGNYWDTSKKFGEIKAENDFMAAVKEDLTASLIKTEDFSLAQIITAKSTLERASRAVELLAESPVSIQAYVETYKNLKSVDKVWDFANNIRGFLMISIQSEGEIDGPFKGISDYLNERAQCMNENSLEKIHDCLKENSNKINQWKSEVKRAVEEEGRKIKLLAEFAKLGNNIDQILVDLISGLEAFNIDNAYLLYLRLQEIKDKAIKELEDKTSKNERRIIENMQKADELVDEMGDSFWEAIKSLRNKNLIRILIERSA
jgi:hypothetical protein